VCLKYNRDRFNCGRCNKCLRTMIALRAAGALERCRTLPGEVDLGAVANIRIEGPADRIFLLELVGHLRETGSAPELLTALDAALAASGRAGAAALFEQALECLPNNAEASYLLAFSLTAAGRESGRALALFDAALAGGFDEFWIRYNRAALLEASGRRREALADARRAAELDPSHGGARAVLGALLETEPA
jgi:tetratricopeptide (TPR) repeat protein